MANLSEGARSTEPKITQSDIAAFAVDSVNLNLSVTLYSLGLTARGTEAVGEMTTLLSLEPGCVEAMGE